MIHQGDALSVLRTMPAESVQCVVTSPPYWGLRDYGVQPMAWGGEPDCVHGWVDVAKTSGTNYTDKRRWQHTRNGRDELQPPEKRVGWKREQIHHGATCELCGAWAGSLGLEPTPELFVAHVVEVFREVRRVLRKDGTLWLNLGDSYASPGGHTAAGATSARRGRSNIAEQLKVGAIVPPGLKQKDLVGIPWRVAFALQADGWYLRSDIIWSKPNPMPESVTDRPTKAHEYLFLMSKSERYFYDAGAIREPVAAGTAERYEYAFKDRYEQAASGGYRGKFGGENGHQLPTAGRNKRTVWEIATQPCPEAHFATYPEALVEPCIKAGCPKGGTVLDPFLGSGTTAVVAKRLGREYIGIELNPAYIGLAEKRIGLVTYEPELFEETA